ncbi:MAG: hypothetical protein ACE5HA_08765 [Anaerolineae bacterium]
MTEREERDRQAAFLFERLFETEDGVRALQHLADEFAVNETHETEEQVNLSVRWPESGGGPPPLLQIDPIALGIRLGRKYAYWYIVAMRDMAETFRRKDATHGR